MRAKEPGRIAELWFEVRLDVVKPCGTLWDFMTKPSFLLRKWGPAFF